MTINDGGPAFPHDPRIFQPALPGSLMSMVVESGTSGGMTLRDWFAGQAVLETARRLWANNDAPNDIAETAYMIADAMLAQRQKEPT